jgi:hypothetical protein
MHQRHKTSITSDTMASVADGMLWTPELPFARIIAVPRSTYQTWDARGLVQRPASRSFTKRHVVEALICKAARDELSLNATRMGMDRLRDGLLDDVLRRVRDPQKVAPIDLVVNKSNSTFDICATPRELARAVRDPRGPRTCVVTPLGNVFANTLGAFEKEANRGAAPSVSKLGRPPKSALGSVTRLTGG